MSLLSGASPGVHWTPGGQYFERRIRFAADDPMVGAFRAAGYPVEPAAENPDYTVVVTFPVRSEAKRSEDEVSIFEKAHLAAMAQHHWADNAVSVTVSFNPEQEGQHVGSVLSMYAGQLKSVSFLPMATAAYAQPPYTKITREEFDAYAERLLPLDLVPIYDSLGAEAVGEKYCETDVCQLKTETG